MVLLAFLGSYFLNTASTLSLLTIFAFLFLFRSKLNKVSETKKSYLEKVKWDLILLVISGLIFQKGFTEIEFFSYCKEQFIVFTKEKVAKVPS